MNRPLDRDRHSTSQVWLDVVSAVDYLSQGHRPGLTVYDALEEALRWQARSLVNQSDEGHDDVDDNFLPWTDPDALRTSLEHLALLNPVTDDEQTTSAYMIHSALANWVNRMADRHNESCRWAHPNSDRGGTSPVFW